jgi:two-component system nitrogen regulation response regulator GlnG
VAVLLAIDDDRHVLYALKKGLGSDTLQVITAREALEQVRRQCPDVVILDAHLPDLSGLDALDHFRQIAPHLPVVLPSAVAVPEMAIEAAKRGAFDYLLKPVDFRQLCVVVGKALAPGPAPAEPAPPPSSGLAAEQIVGRSAARRSVYKAIGLVAPQDLTVLILGESDTGKELVARALHRHSQRSRAPFLALNCAAIPEALLESELFGHEKGAFTGADRRRAGKFEQADGGTIFLDEIGDMSRANAPADRPTAVDCW